MTVDPNQTSDDLKFAINPIFPSDEEILACQGGVANMLTAIQAARTAYANYCPGGNITLGPCVGNYCGNHCKANNCANHCSVSVCQNDHCPQVCNGVCHSHCQPNCHNVCSPPHCDGYAFGICWWGHCDSECNTICNNECTTVCPAECVGVCDPHCNGQHCEPHCGSVCNPQCRAHGGLNGRALPFKGIDISWNGIMNTSEKEGIINSWIPTLNEINTLDEQQVPVDNEEYMKTNYPVLYRNAISMFSEWAYAVQRAREYA